MNSTDQIVRPLEGLVILDLVDGPLAPLCRLYSDLGAEVVRVEFGGASDGFGR